MSDNFKFDGTCKSKEYYELQKQLDKKHLINNIINLDESIIYANLNLLTIGELENKLKEELEIKKLCEIHRLNPEHDENVIRLQKYYNTFKK
tara:strand:+ start:963 stop:1238 length:276 start_codon:yes stop_codon:yes gene_type:complete